MSHPQKSELRQKFLQLRQNLTPEQVQEKSQLICQKIAALEVFQKAQHILLYYPHGKEVDLLPLIDQFPKKNWYLPKLISDQMFIALPFSLLDPVEKNSYGIPEPIESAKRKKEEKLELILVPGLVFDVLGNRLGMGKGYYDRYLKSKQEAFKIGVAFNQQIVDHLPTDSYDVPVDLICSDK